MHLEGERFQIVIKVTPGDIDALDHVNNVTYLRWVQDVAVAHWLNVTTQEERQRWFWIVLRHEIDYKRPGLLGDEIVVETWVGASIRLKFERFTEIRRLRDGELLAKAKSWWCPIDAHTRRPTAASDEIRRRFSIPEIDATEMRPHDSL
jgi:acyl-CoA thioester hydrolase